VYALRARVSKTHDFYYKYYIPVVMVRKKPLLALSTIQLYPSPAHFLHQLIASGKVFGV